MIVWYEFPGMDDAILEVLGLISEDLFVCSKQLHVNENTSMHHANVIQGFLNVYESVEISVWLRGRGMKGQITYMVVDLSEPCFQAMSFSNPFHAMASSRPRLLRQMCLPFVQFLNWSSQRMSQSNWCGHLTFSTEKSYGGRTYFGISGGAGYQSQCDLAICM